MLFNQINSNIRKPLPALVLFLFLLAGWQPVSAQKVNLFPTNADEFYANLTERAEKTTRNDTREAVTTFVASCKAGTIKSTQLQDIIATLNAMENIGLRIHPNHTSYLTVINNLIAKGWVSTQFNTWNDIIKKMAEKSVRGKTKALDEFMEFSERFFAKRSFYDAGGKRWAFQADAYTFALKNDTPSVSFNKVLLIGATFNKDSIMIADTKGSYWPLSNIWRGEGGRVTWERNGIPAATAYATLDKYVIEAKQSGYKAENVTLTYSKYFNTPIKGTLTDQIATKVSGVYDNPQFTSTDLNHNITGFSNQIKYYGGFALEGPKLIGFGTEENKGRMDFFDDKGKLILRSYSKRFGVKEASEINAQQTAVSLYFGKNDSIYHPGVNLRYDIANKELRLVRDAKASAQIAFISSYHRLEANVDAVSWKTTTPVINFEVVSLLKDNTVIFESFNLYEPKRLYKYTAYSDQDPILYLKGYVEGGQTQIPIQDFAGAFNARYDKQAVLSTVFDMVADGFVFYNPETEMITLREKTKLYIEARRKKTDFDRILIKSETKQDNAQLDLTTQELIVTGVKQVTLSDSQKVIMQPAKGFVRVSQNRNMDIDGTILAGNVDFVGKNMHFDYDKFNINMDTVNQMLMYIKDPEGKQPTIDGNVSQVKTPIRDISGTLSIDRPDNKSGREMLKDYPSFTSRGNSYIYYDDKNLYNGAYKRDQFYFKLKPFTFNDLDELTPDLMSFPGTMKTAGIFPDFDQISSLRKDFTLGFERETEANAMPIYAKGKYSGNIQMSGAGLRGTGEISYMTSKFTSQQYEFLPDSTLANCDLFEMKKQTTRPEFPSGYNAKVRMKWLPKADGMHIIMKDTPFTLYDEKIGFKGELLISENGLKANGILNFREAALRSNEFVCLANSFKADTSDVVIKNKDIAKVAFNSYNVRSKVDMEKYTGEFTANGDNIPITLPFNDYKTTAKEYIWLMNENIINLRMPDDPNQAVFESTHPDQAGLKYQASGAVVDIANNTIKVDGVPYIVVGDAKIRPDNTQVNIKPGAVIETLKNALMVTDKINEYHSLEDCTLDIKSAYVFKGNGTYQFKVKGLKKQKIVFDEITSLKDEEKKGDIYYTFAEAKIPEERSFKLSSRIDYKGKVNLDSRKQYLIFDGLAKLDLVSKDYIDSKWFKLKDDINPDNVQIDVTAPIGERNDTLTFGISQDMDALELYPTFLFNKRTPLDVNVFNTNGELQFDPATNTYKVGTKERVLGVNDYGELYTLRDDKSSLSTEGAMNLGKYGLVDFKVSGKIDNDLKAKTFDFKNITMAIDFMFDKKLIANMASVLRTSSADNPEIKYTDESIKSVIQLVPKDKMDDVKRMLNQMGYVSERYKGLDKTLLLTNVTMVWDTSTRTIRSVGQIGVAYIGDQYINRMVDGYIEIGIRRSGDYFDLYFETKPQEGGGRQWYYFTYTKGQMRVISADPTFNQGISDAKEKDRTLEDKKTGLIYQYKLAPMLKRNQFVGRMKGSVEDVPEPKPANIKPKPEMPTPDPTQDRFDPVGV